MPVVTVLITTYNYGRFLEEAIESVVSQDYPQDRVQIVVVDDGSTDDTAERVKKYGSQIEYFYQANGGQASALNLGMAKARGEIVALLDADDLFLPGKLTRVAEAFARHPSAVMVYHRLQEWHMESGERRESNFPLVSGDIYKVPAQFHAYRPHPTSCVSFRRAPLERLLPIPEGIRMLADAYTVNLIPFIAPILAIPESLVTYRLHGKNSYFADENQCSPEARGRRQQQWAIVIDGMTKWLSDNGYTRKQPSVRSFLDRWTLYREAEEFVLRPPGRFHFFLHLLLYNRCYGPHLSRRLRVINRVNALGALVVGYKHFHLLEKWRLAAVGAVKRAFGGGEASGERML